jgi:flagellar protein FlaD
MAIPVGSNAGLPPAAAPQAGAGGDFQEVNDFQEVPGAPQPAAQAPAIPQPAGPAQPPLAGPRPGETFQVVTTAPELGSQSTMERLDGVERTLEEAIRRIDTIDKFTEAVRNDINQVKESISHMEANMRELTSLYDLISSQVNPFIDMETAAKAAGAAEEAAKEEVPEFDALFEPTPEMGGEGEFMPVEPGALPPAPLAPVPDGLMAPEPMQMGIQAMPGMPVMGAAPVPPKPQRMARLTQIGSDSMCLIALMRWIEFMLGRVKREQIPSLLGFYVRIGWISDGIKQHVMDVIRGIRFGPGAPVGGATGRTYGAYEAPKDKEGDVVMAYSKEAVTEVAAEPKKTALPPGDDWKLAPEDHLKTLIFIEKIRGTEVDKNKLEELERDVLNLRKGLDGFFGL